MQLPNPKPKTIFTIDEYLDIERQATERHEYMDGRIFAMAGESLAHGDISVNVVVLLGNQLKGTPCRALTKDSKVHSGPTPLPYRNKSGLYSYPDIVVVCGEPEFHDEHDDVILNPTVLIEVLSSGTEEFDRGEKCARYQMWNRTLEDILLIAQDRPQIDHIYRQPDRTWTSERVTGLDASVVLPSIHCTLPLADVYGRVKF